MGGEGSLPFLPDLLPIKIQRKDQEMGSLEIRGLRIVNLSAPGLNSKRRLKNLPPRRAVLTLNRSVMSDSGTPGCSLPGSSVHGILQTGILEWLPCPSPVDLPNPGTEPTSLVSPALAGGFFTTSATRTRSSSKRNGMLVAGTDFIPHPPLCHPLLCGAQIAQPYTVISVEKGENAHSWYPP